jgi:CheY-like chemotaxis protein
MSKKRILLVDDEPGFTRLLRLILPSFEVCEENDATQAVATTKRFKPDLILLDVIMPGVDGGMVAAEIRADPVFSDTPIVFLTAIISSDANGSGLIDGYPFLAKPVTKDKLLGCINRLLPPDLGPAGP